MAKKKTAAQKAAEKASKASMPTGIYDLDKVLGSKGRVGGGTDDLDQFLRDEQRRQIAEIKGIQVEEIKLKAEKRVKDLRKQVGSGMGGVTGVSPQEIVEYTQVISQLPEAQRPIAIQALAAFRQQSGTEAGGSLAPLLMMQMLKDKPQTSMVQLVEAMKGLSDIQKGNQPNWGGMEGVFTVAKMLGDAKDVAYQGQIALLRKEIEDIKPYDPVAYTKGLMEVAQGMGYKPGTGEENVDLAKYKLEHATLLQKSDQEFQLLIKKMDRDDDRMIALIEVLKPAVQSLSVAGASRMTGVRAGGAKQVPCPNPECGYTSIWITDDAPAACPQCNQQVVTQVYDQKLKAQQAQQQQPQTQPQQEERKPPPVGDVKV